MAEEDVHGSSGATLKPMPDRPILVVDDDEDIALAVGIETNRPSLVLLDLGMPVLDGRGFMREARAQGFDSLSCL
jgi:hypothetical protein